MHEHAHRLLPRMSPVLVLLLYVGASVAIGALLSFPVYTALQPLADPAFDSVLHRVVAVTLLLLLPLYLQLGRAGEPDALPSCDASADVGQGVRPSPHQGAMRKAFGFGCSPRTFCIGFFGGLVLGIVVVSPLVAAFLALGARAPSQSAIAGSDFCGHLAYALLGAVIIGVVEEAYFRGALLAPLHRLFAWRAVSVVSIVYAVVHFLGAPLPAEDVSWTSGLWSIASSDLPLDSFLALLAAGLFLGALRYRFGHIAVGAGFHAGWVFIMKLNQEYTDVVPSSEWLFLEGAFGGTMGYLGLLWIAMLGAGWYAWERMGPRGREPRSAAI